MVEINRAFIFPNSTFIFTKDGKQIDPNSDEGKIISGIVAIQEAVHEQNTEQRKHWILTTFPRDPSKQKYFMDKFGLKDLKLEHPNTSDKKNADPK